jgi:tetratricopeptide (TPR) repeat protein
MSVLDLAGANQNTITFVTNLGHRVYSDDLLLQMDQSFNNGDFYENQANHQKASRFLESALEFPEENFDGVLLWDTLEYLAPPLLETVIKRLHRIARPGSCLFALFHAQERGAAPTITSYSYRIFDNKTILMIPRGQRSPAQFFNNRALERLFQDFHSVKFFLTRDHLREVIVRR